MNLQLKLRKLQKMSANEIRVRIRERLRQQLERRMSHTPIQIQSGEEASGPPCLDFPRGSRQREMHHLETEVAALHAAIRDRSHTTAARILDGPWEMLGHVFELDNEIDWAQDPRSEYRWPQDFYADLPLYSLPAQTDVKYVWEVGRMQYIVELARGWLLTGEEPFARRARDVVVDWIRRNPIYKGIHWASALEVSVRAISWLWTLAALAEWKGWRDGDIAQVTKSLAEHAAYLEHHFSFYSSPYNHLIGEATGLYLIARAMTGRKEAQRWSERSRAVLLEHGPRQFYQDGFSVEQATGYHYYTLGFLAMAIVAARDAGEPLEGLEPIVHRAFQTGLAFRQPDGRWPAIGDVDSARSIPVHHEDFWDFDSLCAVGAVLFDDPSLKIPEVGPGEELFWLLGCDGVGKWYDLTSQITCARSTTLKDSGYAIACRGGDWMLFDAGPVAHGLHPDATPSTAHGHADTFQVLYFADGNSLLDDSGTPSYAGPDEWVGYFRSPEAHSTLQVEGVDIATPVGALAWSNVIPPPRLDTRLEDGIWLAAGRQHLSNNVVVERHVCCVPGNGLWVADYIQTDRPRRVAWYWQTPPRNYEFKAASSPGSEHLIRAWCTAPGLSTTKQSASCEVAAAWRSTGYGRSAPGRQVCSEVVAHERLLCVHHCGVAPKSMEVQVHGEKLQCLWGMKGWRPVSSRQLGNAIWRLSFQIDADSAG